MTGMTACLSCGYKVLYGPVELEVTMEDEDECLKKSDAQSARLADRSISPEAIASQEKWRER